MRPGQLPAHPQAAGTGAPRAHLPLRRDAPASPAARPGGGVGAGGGRRACAARPASGRRRTRSRGRADRQSSTRRTTPTWSGSCSVPRATPSTSRSWSAPSSAAAGACPTTWPTCCSCASTASTSSTRAMVRVASAAGQRVPHDLLARVVAGDRGPPESPTTLPVPTRWTGTSAPPSTPTCWCGSVRRSTPSGTPSSARPSTTTCCPASGCACTRRTPTRCASSVAAGGAADLARHALASHDLPTALTASVEAGEQALATGGPDEAARHFTKALEIYDKAAAPPRRPAGRGRAGRPDRRGAVWLRPARDSAVPGRLPPRLGCPPTRPVSPAPGCCWPGRRRCSRRRPTASRRWSPGRRSSSSGPTGQPLRARILAMHAQMLVWQDDFDERPSGR